MSALAHPPTPAEAHEAAIARGDLPAHWADPARAPRWWCEACDGTGENVSDVDERIDDYGDARLVAAACAECEEEGVNDDPPSIPALVAVAALGVAALARAEAIVAETWPGRALVWRVMTAEALREHHKNHCAGTDVTPALVFSREMTPPLTNFEWRPAWQEVCPYGGGFGTPDDDRYGVHRAWPALRALATMALHLLSLDSARVVLGVEAVT